ncbi:MAG: ATP-binding cassette domain-containing protein [Angelakisella sp.]|jgi:D-methionine transport system ATP-binding protein|nr:ATP-binding cassette domain-containing protein [Angelakisella sp.]MCI9666878.1 ATP-binding cassette domain-containing protein [Angelakisella sp.]
MIEIDHLTKEFDNPDKTRLGVLRDVSLTVEDGDIYGIIGMSGAGKSTMLRLIGLLDTPTSGTITVEGKNLSTLAGKAKIDYYKTIGTVFQGYNLLMQKTVAQNILFPLTLSKGYDKAAARRRVAELLEITGLTEKAEVYPSQLSGGQKQRVAIARALATSPKLLLCDEPTSALDSLTTRSILELLSDINHRLGVTIIIITHEIAVVRKICNKVAVLEGGVLVDNGPIGEVLDSDMHPITRSLFFGRED